MCRGDPPKSARQSRPTTWSASRTHRAITTATHRPGLIGLQSFRTTIDRRPHVRALRQGLRGLVLRLPAVDQHGQVIGVYMARQRDIDSARTFFGPALAVHGDPAEVITDRAPERRT